MVSMADMQVRICYSCVVWPERLEGVWQALQGLRRSACGQQQSEEVQKTLAESQLQPCASRLVTSRGEVLRTLCLRSGKELEQGSSRPIEERC